MASTQTHLPSRFERGGDTHHSLAPLRRQIERLFEDFGSDWPLPSLFESESGYLPAADYRESDKELSIRVELPGVDPKEVQVNATDHSITISGEKKSEYERRNGDRFVSERSFGAFERTFDFPFAVDPSKIDAKFDKGVLLLTVPKPAEAQSRTRRIKVQS